MRHRRSNYLIIKHQAFPLNNPRAGEPDYDPRSKAVRFANYVVALRMNLLLLSRACGASQPSDVRPDQLEFLDDRFGAQAAADIFGRRVTWPTVSHARPVRDQYTQDNTSPAAHQTSNLG